jgi:general secretion pathway protein B
MSILLEALRKSEKNQRVREAPTIHSDDPSGPVSERLQTGPLAVLLIAALFASGWLVWRQYQPPVNLDADRIQAVTKPVAVDRPVEPVVSSPPGTRAISGQARTPVESYQPPNGGESRATTGAQGPATSDAGNTVANVPMNNPVKPEPKTNTSSTEPIPEPAANKTTGGAEQEIYHPGEPAPIGYWELPDAIRAEVPEFKFSVLVFAADPADRFVLIGGQRLEEGDSVQPGLEVKEIRRDGVVFSYRLYQFLVER